MQNYFIQLTFLFKSNKYNVVCLSNYIIPRVVQLRKIILYKSQTYERLTCGSLNVVYAIHCIRCYIMYVDETGESLRSRINGHQAGIIIDGQKVCFRNIFRVPGLSVADMKVQILKQVCHSSGNPVNTRPRQRP